MAYSMNEAFPTNMVGKEVAFDVQPYARGKGTITKCTPRVIKTSQWMMPYGRVNLEYECFDLELKVFEGHNTGALWGGVPVPGTTRSLAGKSYTLTGVGYEQLHDAVKGIRGIVIAMCG